MTEERNDRTRPTEPQQNLSLTVRGLDRDLLLGFKKWQPRFQMAIDNAVGAAQAWDTLVEGCNEQDLWWAFYWAVVVMDTGSYFPEILKEFHQKSHELLHSIRNLQPILKEVMDIKISGAPVWYEYFGFLGLSEKEAFRFWRFSADLDWFARKLALSVGEGKKSKISGSVSPSPKEKLDLSKGKRKKPKSHSKPLLALPGELLHLYIKECSGKPHHKELSSLLELASEAYGLDVDKAFTQGAIETAYKRFCRYHSQKVNEIDEDIRELWRSRIEDNKRLDLIPFLIAREQARQERLIDYVKGLYSKPKMPF
jgi:hypothetical protein